MYQAAPAIPNVSSLDSSGGFARRRCSEASVTYRDLPSGLICLVRLPLDSSAVPG